MSKNGLLVWICGSQKGWTSFFELNPWRIISYLTSQVIFRSSLIEPKPPIFWIYKFNLFKPTRPLMYKKIIFLKIKLYKVVNREYAMQILNHKIT